MRFAAPLFILLISLGLVACSSETESTGDGSAMPDDNVVAMVNDVAITADMLDLHIQRRAGPRAARLSEDERETLLLELVEMELIAQDARDHEMDDNARVKAQVENMRRAVLAHERIEHLHREPFDDEMLEQLYGERFADRPHREYRIRQILLESRDDAETILEELADGAEFADLAQRYSAGPGASDGGDPGWMAADQMADAVAERVMELSPGEYSEQPVETSHGWYVIKLQTMRTARPPEFDAVRGILQAMLMDQRVKAYLQELRDAGNVMLYRPESNEQEDAD